MSDATQDPRLGLSVTHRRYVPYSHAHYAGNLVDGAYSLACFGDVATELCIRTDGDEGLFASYADVQFLAPVRAGDVLEITATVVRVGPPQPGARVRRDRRVPGPAGPFGERRRGARPSARRDHGTGHRRRPGVTGSMNARPRHPFGQVNATRRATRRRIPESLVRRGGRTQPR